MRVLLLLIAALPCVALAADDTKPVTVRHAAMGTEYRITLYPPSKEMFEEEVTHLTDEAFAAIDSLEKKISTWIPESQISKVNEHAGEAPYKTSDEIINLLQTCKEYYRDSDGGFDVTVGPLLSLWGFYRNQGHLPKDAELQEALAKVGFDKIEIDPAAQTVHFKAPGMRIDFGGIGKGLALDRAAAVLTSLDVKSALLDSGTSTVVAVGTPPGKDGWTVRIRSPYNKDESIDEVLIRNESLSTSSDAENFVELDGKKYGHIFDPRTGKPVEGMLSTTAIAPLGIDSDALSTAFFVMGLDKIRAYCKAHPRVRAIVVVSDGGVLKPVRINFPAK